MIKNSNDIKANRKKWTKEEDLMFVPLFAYHLYLGFNKTESLEIVADMLGRTYDACENRWRKHLKFKYGETIKKIEQKEIEFQGLFSKHPELFRDYFKLLTNIPEFHNYSEIEEFLNIINKKQNNETKNEKKQNTIQNSNQKTKLEYLLDAIKLCEKENFKIINSGKGGNQFIVINNEGDYGYLVTVENNLVKNCNCPHHQYRQAICKHMVKVAIDKKLELF